MDGRTRSGGRVAVWAARPAPRSLGRTIRSVFPDLPKTASGVVVVPTLWQTAVDLIAFGEAVEAEKNACLEAFFEWADQVVKRLEQRGGHWANFTDPCSGYPVHGPQGGTPYVDVEGMQAVLSFPCWSVGSGCSSCAVISHPEWGTKCYPATLFTTGSPSDVLEAIEAVEADAQKTASVSAPVPASTDNAQEAPS